MAAFVSPYHPAILADSGTWSPAQTASAPHTGYLSAHEDCIALIMEEKMFIFVLEENMFISDSVNSLRTFRSETFEEAKHVLAHLLLEAGGEIPTSIAGRCAIADVSPKVQVFNETNIFSFFRISTSRLNGLTTLINSNLYN